MGTHKLVALQDQEVFCQPSLDGTVRPVLTDLFRPQVDAPEGMNLPGPGQQSLGLGFLEES